MRVACQTVDGFLSNLEHALSRDGAVYNGAIYADVYRIEESEHKTSVNVQVSCVVDVDPISEEGQYLLEVGEDCGMDYTDGDQESVGSDNAQRLLERVEGFCSANSSDGRTIRLLPGRVGL